MILAAGLTPAWQQILEFDAFQPGEVNRARAAHWCASGKVLNVGLALQSLGAKSQTLSLAGGLSGEAMRREFAELGVPARWVTCSASSRVCTTILDSASGTTTELVENSAPATPEELEAFANAYADEASRAELVVLSGSLPEGTPATLYRDLLRSSRCPAVLDVRGPELLEALAERPLVVKPNREELARTLGRPLMTRSQVIDAMHELNRLGAAWVVVTNGRAEVLATGDRGVLFFEPLTVPTVNPIGCGDCFAAGMAWGIAQGCDVPDAIPFGIAAAADNAAQLLPSRLDADRVQRGAESVVRRSNE